MRAEELLASIYLGDRCCMGFIADTRADLFSIRVDCISRVRSESGHWEFYTAEDIEQGYIVFAGLGRVVFDPSGRLANDLIHSLSVVGVTQDGLTQFELLADWGGLAPPPITTKVLIEAREVYLSDPRRPGLKIT